MNGLPFAGVVGGIFTVLLIIGILMGLALKHKRHNIVRMRQAAADELAKDGDAFYTMHTLVSSGNLHHTKEGWVCIVEQHRLPSVSLCLDTIVCQLERRAQLLYVSPPLLYRVLRICELPALSSRGKMHWWCCKNSVLMFVRLSSSAMVRS